MKKYLGVLVLVVGMLLSACGTQEDSLVEYGDKQFTKEDYINKLQENIYEDERQWLVLSEIIKMYEDKKLEDELYEKEMVEYASYYENEDDITDEDRELVRERVKTDVSFHKLYLDTGIVEKEDVEKEFGKGVQEYEVSVVTFLGEDTKVVGAIEKELGKDDYKKEDIEGMGDEVFYESIRLRDYNMLEEFKDVTEQEVGYIGKGEYGDYMFVYKLKGVQELTYEEVEHDLVLELGMKEVENEGMLLRVLDEQGKIKISKEMREFLELDKTEVKGLGDGD